jgi:hypothetical protein
MIGGAFVGFIIFIGMILACSGWFVYLRTPSWVLTGAPSFMTPINKLVQVQNDFMSICLKLLTG